MFFCVCLLCLVGWFSSPGVWETSFFVVSGFRSVPERTVNCSAAKKLAPVGRTSSPIWSVYYFLNFFSLKYLCDAPAYSLEHHVLARL